MTNQPSSPSGARTSGRARKGLALLAVLTLTIPFALANHEPSLQGNGDGTSPATNEALAGFNAQTIDHQIWAVEGKIQSVDVAARIIRVNGFSFIVPDVPAPIDVGDPGGSDQKISWETFTSGPVVGWTVIANGRVEQASASPPALRFVAGFIFVEEAENLIMGFVTRNSDGSFYVNGVNVVMETDPRIASGNAITDANGAPLAGGLGAIPEGTLVIAEGAYDTTSGHFRARVVEADFVAPPPPGAGDTVTITRAEERPGELRVEGGISQNSEPGTRTITLYGYATDPGSCEAPSVAGSVIQSEVPLDLGTWRVRVRSATADAYEYVCAASFIGGARSGITASPTGV